MGGRARYPTRRELMSRGAAAAILLGGAASPVLARDYASRREALDELDRLSAACGMRLGAVGRAYPTPRVQLLVARFLDTLRKHRDRREDVRRRFALARGLDPASQAAEVDADLPELRQALDDLMIAYAESLPVFGDSSVVSRLAVNMVEVSRLRTVIDLWAETERT